MINCIIIEDQAPAQRIIKKYISDYGDINVKAIFSDPILALEYLRDYKVDLIFLDIHLPKLSGMDFLKVLNFKPLIVLTTAFQEYAVQSYDYEVIDYLLKPISYDRFSKSMDKIKRALSSEKSETGKSSLLIKVGYEYVSVDLSAILYVKSDGDYTFLFCKNEKHMVSLPLKYWNENLNKNQFCQIHRSYLVSLNKIDKVSSGTVRINNQELPIGRKFKQTLKDKIRDLEI